MMPRRSPYFSSSAEAVFSPTPGTPGKAVGGVAAHGGEVGVLAGQHGVLLDDDVVGDALVVADAAGDVEHADVGLVVDELEQVAVAGDDVDGHVGLGGEGADHVVGLVAVLPDHADPVRRQHGLDDRHLDLERVGYLFDVRVVALDDVLDTVALVARHQVDAPLRAPVVVPRAHEMGGAVLADEAADEVEQTADGVHRCAVVGEDLGDPEERPEVQAGGVQNHHPLGAFHTRIVPCASVVFRCGEDRPQDLVVAGG